MKPTCFLNGRYLDTTEARVSALDRGFLFGEGLFEAWRLYRGHAFGLAEHTARMNRSAKALGIPFDPNEPWGRRSLELAKRNGLDRGGATVRLTITRGAGDGTLLARNSTRPTRLLLIRSLVPDLERSRAEGVSVLPVRSGAGVNPRFRGLKSLNYLPAVVAKAEAERRGCFEALYCLDDGSVLEGTTSNVFIVRRGVLTTPPLAHGLLAGVTRAAVLRIARRMMEVRESGLTLKALETADEVFITSSSIEVVPVTRLGKKRIGAGTPGPTTKELQRRYRRLVSRRLGISVDRLGE